jgi:hypothetical protein
VVGFDDTADAWTGAWAGGCAAAHGAPTAGAVGGTDAGVPVDVALGRDTGGDVDDVGCDARDAECGIASTVPARIASGLGPISCRLAAYSAGQPPEMPKAAAMPDRVSPTPTV